MNNINSIQVNKDVFNSLSEVKNRSNITKQEALNIKGAILKDGSIDNNERALLQSLTEGKNSVQVKSIESSKFSPTGLVFPVNKGESTSVFQELNQTDNEYLDINESTGMSWKSKIGLAADIVGIFDPSPISDGISAGISASDGDWVGVGLSTASMVPYFGDAAAKPIKILKKVSDNFPHLSRFIKSVDDIPRLLKNLEKLGPSLTSPTKVAETLNAMNNMHKAAAEAYKNTKWLEAAKKNNLPVDGPIPFVPPKRWDSNNPLKTQDKEGFIDAFGNEWRKGPSRTAGEPKEWDVIPKNKTSGISNLSRDGSHVNVSLKGDVTHR